MNTAPSRPSPTRRTMLPKRRRTQMAVCTFNARTLASEASIEALMVQARQIKYDVIGLTETRRHQSYHAVFDTGEELFLGTCDRRGVGGVGVLVNMNLTVLINSFECLTSRIGLLRLNECDSLPAVSIFVVYAPTSIYDEEIEKFYMELEKFYKEDHTFYKIIVGDFNAKIGPRRSPEELHIGTNGLEWDEQGERLSEFIMSTETIHGNSQFQKAESKRWTWESPDGQFHSEIDHIIYNQRFCLTDVSVVPKFQTESDHRLLRAKFFFTEQEERDPYGFGDTRDTRRDRSPIRGSPRREPRDGRNGRDARDGRDMRDHRDGRDMRDHRDGRGMRDARDMRDLRDFRDLRDSRDFREHRDPVYHRYRDMRDSRDPVYRREGSYDRYLRMDDYCRRKDDSYFDRYRDSFDGRGPPGPDSQSRAKERLKREERRREELYRQYFEEIQRRFDAERPVDCSVIVVNKQTKDYAESVGRKVRDLGMVVDLIFLNTEVSLSQALEDVSRGGSPFAIVITQQHQIHRSCTVNIMFGTPQEHRNMPQADAMVLVARNYERYKNECREKEREEIAREAAKMADEAILQEREHGGPEEGMRGGHPPAIQSLINLLADNRYLTAEETDKIINYLRERKERLMRSSTDSLPGPISRQSLGATSGASLKTQPSSQSLPSSQGLPSAAPTPTAPPTSQQELQAKILSLFNSGTVAANSSSASPSVAAGNQNQNFSTAVNSQPQQRSQTSGSQPPNLLGQAGSTRNMGPRPGAPSQGLFGQPASRLAPTSNMASQRPVSSTGINFDNPSVQKALDTLIQSGPALSHLVSQTTAQVGRPQAPLGSYQRHY